MKKRRMTIRLLPLARRSSVLQHGARTALQQWPHAAVEERARGASLCEGLSFLDLVINLYFTKSPSVSKCNQHFKDGTCTYNDHTKEWKGGLAKIGQQ